MARIYADYNATTPISSAAKAAMGLAFDRWGNPSSSHASGREVTEIIDIYRGKLAKALGISPYEIVFTSGGSEANALALMGSYLNSPSTFRLLTSPMEHSSSRDLALCLAKLGAPVANIPVLSTGEIDFNAFAKLLEEFRPTLVSVMAVNNETGVIYPIEAIAALCQKAQVALHIDGIQALGKLPPPQWLLGNFVSLSAHKIGGPKGIGALIVKKGSPALVATHYGGAQEIKRRGGTENVMGILGFGAAAEEISYSGWSDLATERDRFEAALKALGGVSIQGEKAPRIANTSNVHFEGIPSEVLLGALDLDGICVSAGSACSSGSIAPSHVLMAMGLSKQAARECVRFSFGKDTTLANIDSVLAAVVSHVKRIRDRRSHASQS